MANTLSNDTVKQNFPQYASYFLDSNGVFSETVLTNEIALAEAEVSSFLVIPTDCPLSIQLHILNITKYRGFNRLHGDTQFDSLPQIVKDYNATILRLQAIQSGSSGATGQSTTIPDQVRVTANTRKFDQYFDEGTEAYPPES